MASMLRSTSIDRLASAPNLDDYGARGAKPTFSMTVSIALL
jgi:hypothetical protein